MLKEVGSLKAYHSSENFEARGICEQDIEKNKNVIISLLESNYKINFPDLKNVSEIAQCSYEDMLRFTKNKSAILIGIFVDSYMTGFVWSYLRNVFSENRIHINHLVIDEKYRGIGMGTALINALRVRASELGIKTIDLMTSSKNIRALRFYETHGFKNARVQMEMRLGEQSDN